MQASICCDKKRAAALKYALCFKEALIESLSASMWFAAAPLSRLLALCLLTLSLLLQRRESCLVFNFPFFWWRDTAGSISNSAFFHLEKYSLTPRWRLWFNALVIPSPSPSRPRATCDTSNIKHGELRSFFVTWQMIRFHSSGNDFIACFSRFYSTFCRLYIHSSAGWSIRREKKT